MDFNYGTELLQLCETYQMPIWQVMKKRETKFSQMSEEQVDEKMTVSLEIMKKAARKPIDKPEPSIGGLIGGEARLLAEQEEKGKSICGGILGKAIRYAMAVLEVNASMGVIVAAPTAGSAGVIPGVFLALQEERRLSDDTLLKGLYTAGAVGYLLMRNASVAGAEAGCQAEVGAAAAMAAAGAIEMLGGTPKNCLDGAALEPYNLLGLVCDPVAGLVEAPCQNRNSIGAANAIICAEQVLAGIPSMIPFDEMVQAMYHVGRSLPFELRESAMGGCAATPTACARTCEIFK